MPYANIHKNAKPEISFHFNNHCVSPISLRSDFAGKGCVYERQKKDLNEASSKKNVSETVWGKSYFHHLTTIKDTRNRKCFV